LLKYQVYITVPWGVFIYLHATCSNKFCCSVK